MVCLYGNLGFEYWALEVLEELKTEAYEFPDRNYLSFANHGEQWNEANQAKLALQINRFCQVCLSSLRASSKV